MKDSLVQTFKTQDIVLNEYKQVYDFYKSELESRKDYFKWYSTVSTASVALIGYLVGQDKFGAAAAIATAVLILGIAVFNVIVVISKTAWVMFAQMARINDCFREHDPVFRRIIEPIRFDAFNQIRLLKTRSVLFYTLRLPLVLRLMILFNSLVAVATGGLALRAFADSWRMGFAATAFAGLVVVVFAQAVQRAFAIWSFAPMRSTLEYLGGIKDVQEVHMSGEPASRVKVIDDGLQPESVNYGYCQQFAASAERTNEGSKTPSGPGPEPQVTTAVEPRST